MARGVDFVLFKPLYVKIANVSNFSSYESLKIEC